MDAQHAVIGNVSEHFLVDCRVPKHLSDANCTRRDHSVPIHLIVDEQSALMNTTTSFASRASQSQPTDVGPSFLKSKWICLLELRFPLFAVRETFAPSRDEVDVCSASIFEHLLIVAWSLADRLRKSRLPLSRRIVFLFLFLSPPFFLLSFFSLSLKKNHSCVFMSPERAPLGLPH